MQLTPAERFMWHCARQWRSAGGLGASTGTAPAALPGSMTAARVDWTRVVGLANANGMATMLAGYLQATGLDAHLPSPAAADLAIAVKSYDYRARLFTPALQQLLRHAAARGVDVVVLKGLWLSHKIYGRAEMRPGADIDVLVRKQDIPAVLEILEDEMGYGRWWEPLLDDRFYARHHLHQQRCNPGRAIWIEPHWRLDHPYNRLTIDYEAMLARTTPGRLLGQPVRELALPDLIVSLVVHLVKHAVYLPAVMEREDVPRLIVADGMLIYFVDVAEALGQAEGEIDWDALVNVAREGGAASSTGAVLRVCARHLGAPVPATVLDALPVTPPGRARHGMLNAMADGITAAHRGNSSPPLLRFLTGMQESLVFRPIRLLDFAGYLFPSAAYLRRRYGRATLLTGLQHTLRAAVRYLRVGLDTVYFNWQRRRELKRRSRTEQDRYLRYDPLLPREQGG